MALNAIEEWEEFDRFIESSASPVKVTAVQKNLLHRTKLDSEIKSYAVTSFLVLQPLPAKYERYNRTQAALKKKSLDASVKYQVSIDTKMDARLEIGFGQKSSRLEEIRKEVRFRLGERPRILLKSSKYMSDGPTEMEIGSKEVSGRQHY